MTLTLAGKRALVTGSTQGLGFAIARRLACVGCDIVLHGLGDPDAVAGLQQQIEAEPGVRSMYSPADLSNPSAIEEMMASEIPFLTFKTKGYPLTSIKRKLTP